MISPSKRIRLLLLALGISAILGLKFWPEEEEKSWAPNPNYVRCCDPVRPATAPPAPPVPAEEFARPSPVLSDSELTQLVAERGIVVMLRDERGDDPGSFYFATAYDSVHTLASLGFVQASVLLAPHARLEGFADAAAVSRFEVAAPQSVNSAFRERADECTLERAIPLRRIDAGDARWTLALAPGMAEPLASRHLTAADSAEALRLSMRLPLDSLEREGAAAIDTLLARTPRKIKWLRRLTTDDAEILIADVRREPATLANPQSGRETIWDQFSFIAERDVRDPTSPFRVAWHFYGGGGEDETHTQDPVLLLRLGTGRLVTLYTSRLYKEGQGGDFIARVGPAKWKLLASWMGGC
jgi:hypothetical protein